MQSFGLLIVGIIIAIWRLVISTFSSSHQPLQITKGGSPKYNIIDKISEILRTPIDNINRYWNKPEELSKQSFGEEVQPFLNTFYVTDKADGERVFVAISNCVIYIITSVVTRVGKVGTKTEKEFYLFDAEYIEKVPYVFDVLIWQNDDVTNLSFSDRLALFTKFNSSKIKIKKFIKIKTDDWDSQLKKLTNEPRLYKTDGLIFTKNGDSYRKTKNYKWKPIEHTTIDFLVKKVKLNEKPEYVLYVGIPSYAYKTLNIDYEKYGFTGKYKVDTLVNYIMVPFSAASDPHIYKWSPNKNETKMLKSTKSKDLICEMRYDVNKWTLVRIRPDKTVPNSYFTAELVWRNYVNPLTLNDLTGSRDGSYFQARTNAYKNVRHFNSFVKEQILDMAIQATKKDPSELRVVDIGSGKGQDIFRYNRKKIGHVLFMDLDKDALGELVGRRVSLLKKRDSNPMNVRLINLDMNNKTSDNLEKIKAKKFEIQKADLIICSLALHYFVCTKPDRENILSFIKSMSDKNGIFAYTAFDSSALTSLLKSTKKWEANEPGTEKIRYSIIKITPNKIKAILPFSKGKHYDECIVPKSFTDFDMFAKNSYSTYFEAWENNRNYKTQDLSLTDDDKRFISLYHYNIYKIENANSTKASRKDSKIKSGKKMNQKKGSATKSIKLPALESKDKVVSMIDNAPILFTEPVDIKVEPVDKKYLTSRIKGRFCKDLIMKNYPELKLPFKFPLDYLRQQVDIKYDLTPEFLAILKKSVEVLGTPEEENKDFKKYYETRMNYISNITMGYEGKPNIPRKPLTTCSASMKDINRFNNVIKPMHWGQRKLMLSEIDFINRIEDDHGINKKIAFVYPGAAPGNHLLFLMELYPKVDMFVWDPREFHQFLMTSDRNRRKLETTRHHYKNRVYMNPELNSEDYNTWYTTFKNPDYSKQLGFFNDKSIAYFNKHYRAKYDLVCLVSDIRLHVYNAARELAFIEDERTKYKHGIRLRLGNRDYHRDMQLQQDWHVKLDPDYSLLKFKLFNRIDIDYKYLNGSVIMQAWAPTNSPETRLFIKKAQNTEVTKTYNSLEYQNKINFFNLASRQLSGDKFKKVKVGNFKLTDIWKQLIDDDIIQMDAYIEATIMYNYLNNRKMATLTNLKNIISVLTYRLLHKYKKFQPNDYAVWDKRLKEQFMNRLDFASRYMDNKLCAFAQ